MTRSFPSIYNAQQNQYIHNSNAHNKSITLNCNNFVHDSHSIWRFVEPCAIERLIYICYITSHFEWAILSVFFSPLVWRAIPVLIRLLFYLISLFLCLPHSTHFLSLFVLLSVVSLNFDLCLPWPQLHKLSIIHWFGRYILITLPPINRNIE